MKAILIKITILALVLLLTFILPKYVISNDFNRTNTVKSAELSSHLPPCPAGEVEVIFSLDMTCADTDLRPPVVTGPFNGFSGDGNVMVDPDGDDIWEAIICAVPGSTFEYKYAILNFVDQENLIDDAIGGAPCPYNTNFFDFSNRLVTIPAGGGPLPIDAYGICGTCDNPPINVTFTVNMNCSEVTPGTQVAMFGAFNGFCCPYNLEDPDGDNIWTTSLPFPPDENGCITMEYLYMSPNFSNVESFLTNGEDLANCPNINTDFYNFANRIIMVCSDTVLDDYWNTCFAPEEPASGCDDSNCDNGVESWDGCACINITAIAGCTDVSACNYDPNANCADNSCDFGNPTCYDPCNPFMGCMDNTACNFNPDACVDDGSCDFGNAACVYPCFPVLGCTDPLNCNYNPDACIEDGSCNPDSGCTDDTACNFDIDACVDDGSCDYGTLACPDPCNEPDLDDGCDLTDDSFDPTTCTVINIANCGFGTIFNSATCTCDDDVILGCIDPCADNFDPNADVDDGSCNPYDDTCNQDCNAGAFGGIWDAVSCDCINEITPVLGCTDGTFCEYNPAANCDDGTCITSNGEPGTCDDGDCTNGLETWDYVTCTCVTIPPVPETIGCTDTNACNYNPDATCDDGTCDLGNTDCTDACNPVTGCMDATACNYNPDACVDDGTCESPPCNPGCTDPCADNYDPNADEDDGSCNPYDMTCNTTCLLGDIEIWDPTSCSCIVDIPTIFGCTNPLACNYNMNANCDDFSCDLGSNPACNDPCNPIFGCMDDTACNFNPDACVDDGTCEAPPCNPGCTDPCADNYDATADEDDGSCNPYDMACNTDCTLGDIEVWDATNCSCIVNIPTVLGCTDSAAQNYNPNANCEDGTCEFMMCEDPCAPNFGTFEDCDPYDTTCNDDCTLGPFAGIWDANTCSCINEINPINGCTDSMATNYDPAANCDDGSCFTICEEEIVGSIVVPDEGCDVSGLEVMIMAPDGTSITVISDANGNFTVPGGPFLCGTYSATITDANVPACFTETGNIGPIQFVVDGEGSGNDGPFFIANPAVPTLSQWGLIILALLLMTFGALKLYFQKYRRVYKKNVS